MHIYQSTNQSTYLLSIYLSTYQATYLSFFLPICISLIFCLQSISPFFMSKYLTTYLCIFLSINQSVCQLTNLLTYLSIHPSTYLSIHLPIYPSIYLSIHLPIYPSIYLSIQEVRPANWAFTQEISANYICPEEERRGAEGEEREIWKPTPEYFHNLVGRMVGAMDTKVERQLDRTKTYSKLKFVISIKF